ncbi:MAG TPA: protein kinase, partial [Isosphaeraceae bacterium]
MNNERVTCACGRRLRIHPEHRDTRVKCPSCGRAFELPASRARVSASQPADPYSTRLPDDAPGLVASPSTLPPSGPPPRPAPTPVPTRIGRFEVRARLGAGAFGTVYRAYDPVLDRDVALKVPHPGSLQTPRMVERFLREAKASAQLRHPHIVPVFDAGVDDADRYIASAFIAGRPLCDVIEAEGPLDLRRAARIAHDLAGALHYAHSLGIIHRDVKPANIMLDADGHALLMDFGLARFELSEEKLTRDDAVLGTPAYMPPEQARGDAPSIGPASDQYSLGATLYELLTGHAPFEGPPAIVVFNVQRQEPSPPRQDRPEVPPDLETICLKAMAKEPAARFADCGALADDLRRWLDGEPIHARPLGPVERLGRWVRRNPVLAGMAAALIGTLLLGTIVSTYFAVQARARATETALALKRATESARKARAEEERANAKAAESHASAEQARRESARADDEARNARTNARQAFKQVYLAEIRYVQQCWDSALTQPILAS